MMRGKTTEGSDNGGNWGKMRNYPPVKRETTTSTRNRGRGGTRGIGVRPVESGTEVGSRVEFRDGEPHVISRGVTEPMDEILKLAPEEARVED